MTASPTAPQVLSPLPFEHRVLALVVILAAQLMLQMDFLIVMVALPQIQMDLGFSAATLSWVPNAFALAFGGLLLLGGRLGDAFGRVRAFQLGLAVFVLASLLGGLAQGPLMLIVARVFQGVGAAVAAPSVLALVTNLARNERERNRGMALFITVSSIGASAGLILGGALTEYLSWRWSLLINVPIGALVLLMIGRLVVETPRTPSTFDISGALTATLGSIALVFGFIRAAEHGWTDAATLPSFVIAIVLLATFRVIEGHVRQPLLDLNLLRNKTRVVALVTMAVIVGMHFSMLFLVVQYFQKVLGFTPLYAGLAYLPVTCTVFAVTHFMPGLIERFGAERLLIGGCALVSCSFIGFVLMDAQGSYMSVVLAPMFVHSLGIALVFTPGTVLIMQDVPAEQSGSASGLLQMVQQIGGALGIAVITSMYAATSVPGNFVSGLPMAFGVAALFSLLVGLSSWLFTRRRHALGNASRC
ncbi:MFS transporter [Stutzerimonas stutzeri]|uniref:MFS transporter n=1 Tax=Stutzerimonas stutzeri TaxID=316 RepID=W8RAI8_STUST|nr:MFS transporter [Stutzerimonas stutzeri]AHL75432.1 MFS transporter [Stutzerimonas stutzeri]MCQ4328005.1 MFS transporter [Stutzerimonas stutzeri]